jgi:hypothetical protein
VNNIDHAEHDGDRLCSGISRVDKGGMEVEGAERPGGRAVRNNLRAYQFPGDVRRVCTPRDPESPTRTILANRKGKRNG